MAKNTNGSWLEQVYTPQDVKKSICARVVVRRSFSHWHLILKETLQGITPAKPLSLGPPTLSSLYRFFLLQHYKITFWQISHNLPSFQTDQFTVTMELRERVPSLPSWGIHFPGQHSQSCSFGSPAFLQKHAHNKIITSHTRCTSLWEKALPGPFAQKRFLDLMK